MSFRRGPNIVKQGLVLHLDAANQRSFRGEPTENLAYNSNGTIDFDISGLSGSDINLEEISPIVYKITSGTNSGDSSSFRMKFNLSKLENGKTYTLSYNYRIISGGSLFRMTDWCDVSTFISKIDKDYTNYSFSSATGTRSTYDNTFRFMDFRIDNNTVVEIWNIQLEQKPYPTPFVNGTRGTTFETGGGWVDLSANSNHGALENGVQHDSSNKGSLVFDGVDDYVNVNPTFNYFPTYNHSVTYEVWSFTPTGAQWHDSTIGGNGTNIISRGTYSGYNGLGRGSDDNTVKAYYRGSTSGVASASFTIGRDRWYHLVSIWNGSRAELYVDGILRNTSEVVSLVGNPAGGALSIARQRALGGDAGGW